MMVSFVHDFGSILAFTERNFGMANITYPEKLYADANAPDVLGGNLPLLDFFQLSQPRQFVSVSINNNPWPYTCFQTWNCNNVPPYVPGDPDEY